MRMFWPAIAALVVAAAGMPRPALAEVVETTRTLNVYRAPERRDELLRGRVVRESRFAVLDTQAGKGCSASWLRIDDDAWICGRHTEITDEPAGGPTLPELADDELVPHRYILTQDARVYPTLDDAVAGTNEDVLPGLGGFRIRAVRRRARQTFIKTAEGWVPEDDARYAEPSPFVGVRLEADAARRSQGFVRARKGARVVDARGERLRDAARLPHLTFLDDLGEPVRAGRVKLYPIRDGRYVFARDVGRLRYLAPPTEIDGSDERWLDVDLEEQTLIAYEGQRPVRATLVSTARRATPEGVFHIYKKRAVSFMKSRAEHNDKYNLDTPWVMTLKGRIAMHAVYWHDEFGTARSHGCVNLAPQDAKWIWDWTLPTVPPGWLRVDTAAADDGTVVRMHRGSVATSE